MNVANLFLNGNITILVKPNAKKDEILEWDEERKALRVAIAAPPEDNKANIAIVKFFSRLIGRQVRIVRGNTSKRKILTVL